MSKPNEKLSFTYIAKWQRIFARNFNSGKLAITIDETKFLRTRNGKECSFIYVCSFLSIFWVIATIANIRPYFVFSILHFVFCIFLYLIIMVLKINVIGYTLLVFCNKSGKTDKYLRKTINFRINDIFRINTKNIVWKLMELLID